MREHMPDDPVAAAAPKKSSPQSFADRCSELAESAPNDRVETILRKIALTFEVEAAIIGCPCTTLGTFTSNTNPN
jgi:hypothetical protein